VLKIFQTLQLHITQGCLSWRHSSFLSILTMAGLTGTVSISSWEEVHCAITALDGYPSHSDNIHYIQSATLIYVILPSMNHAIHHFCPWHSSHPPFASSWHFLTPKLSHPSHIIGSFVTGTSITSACQEAWHNPVVPSLRRQAMECSGNQDNGDSKWRQSATWRQ